MLTQDKLREIARRLLEKSRANEVKWKPAEASESALVTAVKRLGAEIETGRGAYEIVLPRSKLVIRYVSPTAEPDFIEFDIAASNGSTVAAWKVEQGDSDWTLASNLYSDAARVTQGWDQVISEVEEAVCKQGVIGR